MSSAVARFLLSLFWLLLPGGIASAHAADLIESRAAFRDPGAALGIEAVSRAAFTPFDGPLSAGYGAATDWVQIKVRPAPDGGTVELRIRPTYLDEIRLYEQDQQAPGGWRERVTGDRQPFTERERSAITLGFVVQPQAPYSTYYLRLQSSSTHLLYVEALTAHETQAAEIGLMLTHIVYFAIMLLIMAWIVLGYIQYRQTIFLWCALYQGMYLAYAFFTRGYLPPFLSPSLAHLNDILTSLSVLGIVIVAILFYRALFALYGVPRWLLNGFSALLLLSPVELMLLATDQAWVALSINSKTILLVSIMISVLALAARQESPPGLKWVRIFSYSQTALLLLYIVPAIGLVRAGELTLYAPMLHSVLSSLLILTILLFRNRAILKQATEDRRRLELSQQNLQLEKEAREEQGRFIDMLTHELKTPLGVAHMSLGLLQGAQPVLERLKRALGNINAIIDRTRLSQLAEERKLQAHPAPCHVSELVQNCIASCQMPTRVQATVAAGLESTTDAQLLEIIIANLIDNALKYSPAELAITLALQAGEEDGQPGIRLRVSNAIGPEGMPDQEKLFSKYYRNPAAHRKSGSGLGLYLCLKLAQEINARLRYTGHPDEVEFTLWLPA